MEVREVLAEFQQLLEAMNDCEKRYHAAQNRFCADVEAWFEN